MPRPKKPSTVRLAKDKREEITALLVYFIQALGTATTKEICDLNNGLFCEPKPWIAKTIMYFQ